MADRYDFSRFLKMYAKNEPISAMDTAEEIGAHVLVGSLQ
jgi:hypothetical protein